MSASFASEFFARCGIVALLLLPFGLAGCDDVQMPKVFGDEVPQAVLDAPRAVPAAPRVAGARAWPLVGSVPSRPRDFTAQPVINAAKGEMEGDRAVAEGEQRAYQAEPVVAPVVP